MTSDGSKIPLQLKPGDRIIFSSYAGEAISVDDDELLLMREADVLALIE
jgi:chaperonin GroES